MRAADSTLATTIPIPLDLTRERSDVKYEVTLAELENLVAQAMGKIFNQCRSEAAKRLGVHELDAILVGAQARNFKVDGKSAVNPAGFAGKKISLSLELRFTTRGRFSRNSGYSSMPPKISSLPNGRRHQALFDRADARAAAQPDRCREGDAFGLCAPGTAKGHPVLYREKLGWDFHELIK